MTDKVSVIIPTHNRASRLPFAVESAQKAGTDVEVIVVDDASTDETPDVCKRLPNIQYLRLEKNVRQAGARNAGIAISSGRFLCFLDDDDLRLPNSLDRQIEILTSNPNAGFVYGQVLFSDSNSSTIHDQAHPKDCPTGDIFWRLLAGNFIYVPSVLVSRQHLEHVGFFDPLVTGVEDWELWLRISERYPVEAVEEPVAIYRLFTSSSGQTSSNHLAMSKVTLRAQSKALNLPRSRAATEEARREIRQHLTNSLADLLLCETQIALSEKDKGRACRYFLGARRLNAKQANGWLRGKIATRRRATGRVSVER